MSLDNRLIKFFVVMSGQRGNATLLISLALVGAGLATVETVRYQQSRSMSATAMQFNKAEARNAGESAINLFSHLVATRIVVPVKNTNTFKLGMSTAASQKKQKIWSQVNPNQFRMVMCKGFPSADQADQVYGRDPSNVLDANSCNSENQIPVTLVVERILWSSKNEPISAEVQATSNVQSSPGGAASLPINVRASVRIPTLEDLRLLELTTADGGPTAVGDNDGMPRQPPRNPPGSPPGTPGGPPTNPNKPGDPGVPSVQEFCDFMEPETLSDGSIIFANDGRPKLRPKMGWSGEEQVSYESNVYAATNSPGQIEIARKLLPFVKEGYTDLQVEDTTFAFESALPVEPIYNPSKGQYAKFAYYLTGKDAGQVKWTGVPMPQFKAGCQKTIGDSSPDFCTRVDILSGWSIYKYSNKYQGGRAKTKPVFANGQYQVQWRGGQKVALSPPATALKYDRWMCTYWSYNNVYDPKTCFRKFRGYCRNHDGCFDPATKILQADGSERLAKDIQAGDVVRTADGGMSKVQRVIVGPETQPMVIINSQGRRLTVSQTHPLMTKDGLRQASELKKGDLILSVGGSYAPIDSISYSQKSEQAVYNFLLAGESEQITSKMLIADGIPAGDLSLQMQLEQEKQRLSDDWFDNL